MLSPEEEARRAMRQFGMSEEELTRKFLEHLIDVEGKNPFEDHPPQLLRAAMDKFPDLVERAKRKFGKP